MEAQTIALLFLACITVLFLTGIMVVTNIAENANPTINETLNKESCIKLGCPNETSFVANKDENDYYPCLCNIATSIPSDKVVCLNTEYKAKILGYKKGNC